MIACVQLVVSGSVFVFVEAPFGVRGLGCIYYLAVAHVHLLTNSDRIYPLSSDKMLISYYHSKIESAQQVQYHFHSLDIFLSLFITFSLFLCLFRLPQQHAPQPAPPLVCHRMI